MYLSLGTCNIITKKTKKRAEPPWLCSIVLMEVGVILLIASIPTPPFDHLQCRCCCWHCHCHIVSPFVVVVSSPLLVIISPLLCIVSSPPASLHHLTPPPLHHLAPPPHHFPPPQFFSSSSALLLSIDSPPGFDSLPLGTRHHWVRLPAMYCTILINSSRGVTCD